LHSQALLVDGLKVEQLARRGVEMGTAIGLHRHRAQNRASSGARGIANFRLVQEWRASVSDSVP
jgi:hypothetical protein